MTESRLCYYFACWIDSSTLAEIWTTELGMASVINPSVMTCGESVVQKVLQMNA